MKQAFIYDAIRTPRGKAKSDGGLTDLTPFELLKVLYDALEQRTHLDKNQVEDVVLGCVTQVGEQGGNIAKASLLFAGWPDEVPGLTVNRYCSSGIDAINIAAMKVMTGQAQCTIAGGIEMMSRVPMLSDKATLFSDSVQALRHRMLMMGSGADLIASLFGMSRQQVDGVAFNSQQRAAHARDQGWFTSIIPVFNPVKDIMVSADECIREETSMDELAALEPYFADIGALGVDALQRQEHPQLESINHVHTAGNSPAMADAASLILIGDGPLSEKLGQPARARIVAVATVCDDPLEVVSGCAKATATLMRKQGLNSSDIDLFELHEAFAATSIKCQRDLSISDEKLNVNGGCIALGHPMGATGGIMMGTLIDELERRQLKTGIVAASGAAGSGTAILIECL
ncbi:MAG: acetyl-CoA C-acyltransferase [Porticoccaceae bacterium]|nr:acetyl-CoA C-acyltransferase [Porticoccaceae bacterium]MBT3799155.1 acetyl-CoA C-acyltransferase [Porticoccaceae bacterium]MBT5103388.1 acetyl-CoA C-acyltransferase [Porticoccaceae bacterium]